MRTFLFKTEPSEYAFQDLLSDKATTWSGVKNAAALQTLRSARARDRVLIYHTGSEKSVVGLAVVTKSAYQDPAQPGLTPDALPKHAVVDLKPLRAAKSPVTLAAIKADKRFAAFALVKHTRLSVMLVPDDLALVLTSLAGF